jgi:hypothetical protein
MGSGASAPPNSKQSHFQQERDVFLVESCDSSPDNRKDNSLHKSKSALDVYYDDEVKSRERKLRCAKLKQELQKRENSPPRRELFPRSQSYDSNMRERAENANEQTFNKLPSFSRDEAFNTDLVGTPPNPTILASSLEVPEYESELEIKIKRMEELLLMKENRISQLQKEKETDACNLAFDKRKLQLQLEELQEAQLCPICYSERKNLVLSCGHCFCKKCTFNVGECPICRKPRITALPVFL